MEYDIEESLRDLRIDIYDDIKNAEDKVNEAKRKITDHMIRLGEKISTKIKDIEPDEIADYTFDILSLLKTGFELYADDNRFSVSDSFDLMGMFLSSKTRKRLFK